MCSALDSLENPLAYVVSVSESVELAKLKIPPFARPDGSWNRIPTSMTTKLLPWKNLPHMFPSIPTVNELFRSQNPGKVRSGWGNPGLLRITHPTILEISDRFGNA
jgi:hypothetical protein